ncbi:TaqI-like C-terminal specificity domain-containing protein [Clostridium sp. ZBS15]|uniref:TaqI-like C-terminal specificity domain-containing protein n=1 Tax=Clostridium sp. ZBS15 TaxID=2949969 RepID=UPI00207A07B8|nr:TaqI-like C-terminal specificity domain-containing protein [Clostridium sp. ZBS15]
MKVLNICTLKSGFQGKTSEGEAFKIIKLKDVTKDGIVKYEELENFDTEKMNEKFLLKKGDIILKAKSGDNTAALIKEDIGNIVAASHFIVITVNDDSVLSPEYLVAYLNSEYAQDYFKKHAEGTTLPIIKIKTLEELEIKELAMGKQLEVANMYKLIKEEKLTMEKLIDNREKQFKAYLRELLG